jgi:hypothetical protein
VRPAILFLFITVHFFGQVKVNGIISDSLSKSPIPFVSIGIIGKSVGTLTDEMGKFEFLFRDDLKKDSLKIFAIGYKPVVFLVADFIKEKDKQIVLETLANELEEVEVKAKKIKYGYLGTTSYNKSNCSGFIKNSNNWKGSEAAILAGNKDGRTILLESFAFYVIQNKYPDSLKFRLMFYEASEKKYPRYKTFIRKAIIFKVGTKQGEFTLNLKDYNLHTSKDFFISLECLMDEVDISKFCYAGSISTPSFVKSSAFDRWNKVRGGGGDFNVKYSYVKED